MSEQAEFYIYDGEEDFIAQVCGPRAEAWREAMHYASQCDEPSIQEITRAECVLGPVPPLKSGTEDVARWMIANGYATGHGDDLNDLLRELVDQAKQHSKPCGGSKA